MLEPQSTALFIVLMVVFGLLAWWMIRARQPVMRLLAACLAFLPAMAFGVVAVNKYYGYYQTWGAAISDFSGTGAVTGSPVTTISSGNHLVQLAKSGTDMQLAKQQGYTVRLMVTGKLSHIRRAVYTFLPPQYFQAAYKHYRFPVVELIHGQPGAPQDWINLLDVTATLDQLIAEGRAKPVVLVMPDANGAENISLQCLNTYHGPQDLTYLAEDLPDVIAQRFRVVRPGAAWGIAGYSEGGFCAANMALRYPARFGYAGVMSGYFVPGTNTLQDPYRVVNPFGGNRVVARENTPLDELRGLAPGARIPFFWLGTGTGNKQDVSSSETFWQELLLHQTDVPLVLTKGEGHNMGTWRKEDPAMLAWMTPRLTGAAVQAAKTARQPHPRSSAAARHRRRARPHGIPAGTGTPAPGATAPAAGRTPGAQPSPTRTLKP